MNDGRAAQLVALLGWLVLAGGAFASYRLGWKESVRLALVWAGIFVAITLAISMVLDS